MADRVSCPLPFAVWQEQPKGARTDADFKILETLRKEYQSYNVARTASSKCDLMGLARAGYAKATPRVDEGTEATRVYRLPPSRLDTSAGELEDVNNFGCWDYHWEGYDFLVFQTSYQNQFHEAIHLLYVLAPLAGAAGQLQGSYDKKTDALLLAAGQWTRELHQEIWVYDNAQWIKNKSLWRSVQDTSWDDVILDPKTKAKLLRDVEGLPKGTPHGAFNDGILMIGSTNHIDRLDPAVTKRPSRFDRKYHFKLPKEEERLAYCRYWCEKFAESDDGVAFFPDGICPVIAKLTEKDSFAYLKELFVTSLPMSTRGYVEDDELEMAHIAQGKSSKNDETTLVSDTSKSVAERGEEPLAPEKVMPEVDIPRALRDNVLLNLIRAQAGLLLEEMDHASNNNTVYTVGGATRPPPIRFPYNNLIDEREDE